MLKPSLKYRKNGEKFDLLLKEIPNAVKLPPGLDTSFEIEEILSKNILKRHKLLRLLILGEPGSGKTTIILTLLKNLNEQYDEDHRKPVPVYFHLFSWTNKHKNFADWLVNELDKRYSISKTDAQKITDKKLIHKKLILLLDGLDGLNQKSKKDRDECIKKLNSFIKNHGLIHIVVCCRRKEYEDILGCSLSELKTNSCVSFKKLNLDRAYLIKLLTVEEIKKHLGFKEKAFNRIRKLFDSYEKMRTPLVISIIQKAEITEAQLLSFLDSTDSSSDPLSEIWENLWKAYIDKMFERQLKDEDEDSRRNQAKFDFYRANRPKVEKWLKFFAEQLHKNKREFEIQRIQPSWLSSSKKSVWIFIFRITTYLIIGSILGLTAGLYFIYSTYVTPTPFDLTKALALKLITIGLIAGLKIGLIEGIASYLGKNESIEEVGRKIENQVRKRLGNLNFLSSKLKEKLFSEERLATVSQRLIGSSVSGIIFALFLLLSFDLPNQKQLSYYYSAIFLSCVFGGMILSLIRNEIETPEIGNIDPQKVLIYSLMSTGLGIPYVLYRLLLLPQVYEIHGDWYAIYELIIFMIVGAIYGGVIIKKEKISPKNPPQEKNDNKEKNNDNGIISLTNYAILSFIYVLTVSILAGLVIDSVRSPIVICLGLAVGALGGLGANEGAGIVCIQHSVLRVILYLKGDISWNYANFLNYATNLIFLNKVDNNYSFIHDELLEYFRTKRKS